MFLGLGDHMGIGESLKKKVIIIADTDVKQVVRIRTYLKEQGFINIKIAKNGKKIYDILKPYYNKSEQVGLVIVHEKLPQCKFMEMCMTLSNDDGGPFVPFIVLGAEESSKKFDGIENCLIYYMGLPINLAELVIAVNFQIRLKQERLLRYRQEDRLITELSGRKTADARLRYLVAHDELTSLLNRPSFENQLRLILNRNNGLHQNGALLFLDIDWFSLVNELEGFEVGDQLLMEVVSIIRKLITKNDLFARIGSDEFCLFLDNKTGKEITRFAEKIRKAVYESRIRISGEWYSASVSIGVSPLNAKKAVFHPTEMISRARQACIIAKENGRNLVWEYNEDHPNVQERDRDIYWVPIVRKALIENLFLLFFQPVVDLETGNISHYEALIRMKGPDNEVIGPVDFIPVAERIGLIHRIDHWVVEEAIDFLAALPPNMAHISLAINLSSVAFQDNSLLPLIKAKLDICWIDAKRITFEITETVLVDKIEQTRQLITKIRALGCKFALDDFGAGFCSFNYLKSFPVDYVKIDGQFIRNILDDKTDQILVRSMVEVANKLGKKTIAEFVETAEVAVKLKELGIDFGQGYAFGKPQEKLLLVDTILLDDMSQNEKEPENRLNIDIFDK